jgi:hypothetical protein
VRIVTRKDVQWPGWPVLSFAGGYGLLACSAAIEDTEGMLIVPGAVFLQIVVSAFSS